MKILIGIFTVVFVGSLIYEIFDRVKPELIEKLEEKVSRSLDNFLRA